MPFTDKAQVYNASINALTLGTDEKMIIIGGGNTNPLYTFDAPVANAPKVGIEISDQGIDASVPGMAAFYEGCETIAQQAARACTAPGVDFVTLSLESADPNGANASVEACVKLVEEVYAAVTKPLAVMSCKNIDKDTELLPAIAEALKDRNILLLSCKEENYKTLGVGAVLGCHQSMSGESAVDINLAKQLNVLLSQMGVPTDQIVMNCGTAAAGYGFEYLASTIERVKSAALSQNDAMLQMPIISPVGDDAWSVKEALLEEADMPAWGSREERGIQMEIVTAAAVIASGSDAVILKHPASVKTISEMVAGLM